MADLEQLCVELLARRSLIVASNRGPVEHHLNPDGPPEARRGSGSIVTALSTLAQTAEFTWISSAMGEGDRVISNNGNGPHLRSPLPGHRINLRYVVTPRRVHHKFYNVICNPLLWFLQHYMWNPPYNPNVDSSIHDAWTSGYVRVNQAFARAVIEETQENRLPPVLITHDYHLYLVPRFVREEVPAAIIQHFIHIPWPTPRYWQMIPRYIITQVCSSLCNADVVGFQSPQDRQSFLDSVEEFLPEAVVDRVRHLVNLGQQTTQVKVYPISINVAEVQSIANSPRALEYEARLRPLCTDATIVRIDRAEPNKNVIRGFRAFELLLSRHPELHRKVTFLAFLVPSRTHIRQYQRYMDEIQQIVDQVNRTFGDADWQPVRAFLENNYTQAIAGMKMYDVLLANNIIEGMNLVAKEGPVVNGRDGVLVLSESSGAYHQLQQGALSVSPTDIEGTMEALYRAIQMPPEERKQRALELSDSIHREDLNHWIVSQLQDIGKLI
jgi:trehalose 6-phosphate synthase